MRETILSVMEIERFAIHDGPGIRTVVFLQGCPLSCGWCSNPESQQIRSHLLYMSNKCVACGKCYQACPSGNISFDQGYPVFDRKKCISCRECSSCCPQNAIKFVGERMSVSSILDIICRDKEYYQQSGGGVTISGGEAFVQYDGLTELLVHCKAEGLHTAIETSGQVSIDKIIKIIPLVDLFLFDIKHIDSRILKKETLGNLDIILGNLQYIASQNPEKVIIRVPVLPNFNYKPDIIKEIFRMALNLGIREVHLLPYHTLGRDKYMQMGLPYTFACDRMLTKEDLLPLKRMGEDMCLNVKIGG